ncbi:HET-domain-containing protein [Melanomma pulvis-pyrius CBS 109.77]|uniref:HET-domain-containing protein n=1 Tax=Melanomma pulvis-pyrius CBS 109.77 TaxID=1314802 RepID=A0A6A6XQ36_9PLEO|nr:HET-domain-containing protein [Melanomma pulvis-pyrius CBS 109.77]
MSTSNICNFCIENIVRSKASWGLHHPSCNSLFNSTRNRCAFCSLLYEDVKARQEQLEEFRGTDDILYRWLYEDVRQTEKLSTGQGFTTSLYRWSIRSLGKTRESKTMVALTFRVVPKEEKESDARPKVENVTFGLPERVFYCFSETELGVLFGKGTIGDTTNPHKNAGVQVERWIQSCDRNHKHCPTRAKPWGAFVPTRLLVVGTKGSEKPIQVVDTKKNNIKGHYVTLSHCWGPPKLNEPKKDALTINTMDQFMTLGVAWKDLSKNFQQGIEVARFLEIEYMWIDSLCIIQGDAKDWETEGALMHKVYRNSYCNIAAVDSKDSTGGLFRERKQHQVLPASFEGDGNSPMFGNKIWRAVREDLWEQDLLKTPLYGRGWVFQERMLSPRALHFSKHQIFWDCAEISACETVPGGLPLPLDRRAAADRHWRGRLQEAGPNRWMLVSGANDDSIEEFWKVAVENYTSCDLTQQTDKTIAVWGVAKLVRDSLGEEYGAGLWERELAEQLAWRVADCTISERPKELQHIPSWTWASIKGKILVGNSRPPKRSYTTRDYSGKPLSFKLKGDARPIAHRERSEDIKVELAAMSKELQSAADKRKNSGLSNDPSRIDKSAETASRDQEPKLLDTTIEMQGYINTAPLRWSEVSDKWALDVTANTGFKTKDAIVTAFPDVKRDLNTIEVSFVILSLTHHNGPGSLPSLSEIREDSWYSGVGIMLKPSGERDGRYVRTGALNIQYLSVGTWKYLQNTSTGREGSDEAGMKFQLE